MMHTGYSFVPRAKQNHNLTVQVVDLFWNENLLNDVYDILRGPCALQPAQLWIARSRFLALQKGNRAVLGNLKQYLPDQFADTLILHLSRIMKVIPGARIDQIAGFEVWTRHAVADADKRVSQAFLHIDSDERLNRLKHVIRVPIWGTIFHVGPRSGLSGGETAFFPDSPVPTEILDACYKMHDIHELERLSSRWIKVPQRANRLVVFRGDLPHFVLPVESAPNGTPRTTLLVNLWDHRPRYVSGEAFFSMSPMEFKVFQALSTAKSAHS